VGDLFLSGDGIDRTGLDTEPAADTLVFYDAEGQKVRTYAGRTTLVDNVCFVLVTEIAQRGHDRIRRGLAESAQRRALDDLGKTLQGLDVFRNTSADTDALENFQETLRDRGYTFHRIPAG